MAEQPQKKPRIDYSQLRVLADEETEKTNALIAELEELMRLVRREYDLWFNGTQAKPPYELRNRLDNRVRLLRTKLPKRTAEQFRIGTVLQHYQSLAELWDKSQRKMEEAGGQGVPWMAAGRRNPLQELEEANEKRAEEARQAERRPQRSAYVARIASPDGDEDEMRKIFNSYVAAKTKVGEDASSLDFGKFRQALSKQTKALIDGGKAKAVAYRIEVQGGKVAIKAKPETDTDA